MFDSLLFGHRVRSLGELVEGDISDASAINGVFAAHKIDAVMHFAALGDVGDRLRRQAAITT